MVTKMRMIWYELKKLLSEKSFALIAAMLAVVCALYSLLAVSDLPQADYYMLRDDINGHTQEELGVILERRVLEYKVYDLLVWGDADERVFSDERAAEYIANYENIEKSSNRISAQLALYEAEYQHYLDVSGYSENVRRIVDESNGFSLFSDENSFEYKNGLKIADAYRPLFDVVPEYAPSEGVRSAASNPALDFALLIIACYAAVKLFSEERDNGCAFPRRLSPCRLSEYVQEYTSFSVNFALNTEPVKQYACATSTSLPKHSLREFAITEYASLPSFLWNVLE